MLFDTHFHLCDQTYENENKEKIINHAFENKIKGIINVSAEILDPVLVVKQCNQFTNLWAAIGYHPSVVDQASKKDYFKLIDLIENDLYKKIVAIGECGLDYHYIDNPLPRIQKQHFLKHLIIAQKYNKTIIVHSRKAFRDTITLLKKFPKLRKVIHCFTYGVKEMKAFIDIGCYISYSGIITFNKNVIDIHKALINTPKDKILFETDAPTLSPVPKRGQINYPENIKYTYQKAASLLASKFIEQDLEKQILKNVEKAFAIKI